MTSQQDHFGRHFVYGPGLRLLTGVAWADGVPWDELAYTRNVRRRVLRSEPLARHLERLLLPSSFYMPEAAPEPAPRQQQPQRASRGIQRATAGEMPS